MPSFNLASYVNEGVVWLKTNVQFLFDLIAGIVNVLVDNLEVVLQAPPPVVMAVIFAAFAWWVRSWQFGLFSLTAFLLIDSMQLWTETMSTLSLVMVATFLAILVGIPIGILAARSDAVSTVVRPVLDFMQTMPAFVYLIPSIFFFSIGQVPGVVSTLVFATPPGVRLTELGIRQVDEETVEAAEAFGASPNEVLRQIQVPLALPTIMAGVNQVIMLALSMVVIAGLVGAAGLGQVVVGAVQTIDIGGGFEGGLAVVIVAIFLDRVTSQVQEGRAAATA